MIKKTKLQQWKGLWVPQILKVLEPKQQILMLMQHQEMMYHKIQLGNTYKKRW